jgi:selenoprotein W-related protein
LERELGLTSRLVASSGGVFEVEYQGELIFSKKSLGRFPETGEVLGLLKAKM